MFDLEPVWSPDRSRIAYVHHDEPRNPEGVATDWSPAGGRIAFLGFHEGSWEIDVIAPDGTGDEGSFDW